MEAGILPRAKSAPAPPAQPDMLVATPAGLVRGKASGQGQHLVFTHTNLQRETVLVSNGNVVYERGPSPFSGDIWTVRADGTGDRALVNTPNGEILRVVSGPWMIYTKLSTGQEEHWSVRLDTGAQFFLADPAAVGTNIEFMGTDRALMGTDNQIFSVTLTGTDRRNYTEDVGGGEVEVANALIVGDALIYRRVNIGGSPAIPPSVLFAVSLAGGPAIPLESDQFYTYSTDSIGTRVVYQRCTNGPCDVVSVQTDGTNRVVLASQPANEAVQGVTTDQVIIRRNLSGNDHLIAVPVGGGAEELLMTMTDNEFVETIVDDIIIVRRPSGTWSLNLSGTLKQLSNVAGLDGFVAVGNAICSSDVVWCMPLDGSAPAVKIANEGKVVGVL